MNKLVSWYVYARKYYLATKKCIRAVYNYINKSDKQIFKIFKEKGTNWNQQHNIKSKGMLLSRQFVLVSSFN